MVNRPIPLSPDLTRADDDIAAFEFGRSQSQQVSNPDWVPFGIQAPVDGERIWRSALSGENTTPMFLNEPAARTATLGILRMRGDWDGADSLREDILGENSPLRDPPYEGHTIDQATPEAKRIITVDWGITSVQGLTTVTTRRRRLRTQAFDQELAILGSPRKYVATSHIEVDELSTYALDIKRLADIDRAAADEVRAIIICGILATADLQRVRRAAMGQSSIEDYMAGAEERNRANVIQILTARGKMQQYKIPYDDVQERLGTEYMTRVNRPETVAAIEQEIADPAGLLIPSTVTFYGKRELHKLSTV